MTIQEYELKFNHLSRYAPHMVVDSRDQMNKFLYGVSNLVKIDCRNNMLLGDMNIFMLMTHAQQVEDDNLKEQAKENKKARTGNYDYSQQKSGGRNRSLVIIIYWDIFQIKPQILEGSNFIKGLLCIQWA